MIGLDKKQVFDELPSFDVPWPELQPSADETIVVLDDDPTGTQTVNDLPVLTSLDIQLIELEFRRKTPLFYILTNSRSLTEAETIRLHEQLANNLLEASKRTSRSFQIISRSDSTLRGHFPAETKSLGKILFPGSFLTLLIPEFFEGGRYTIDNIHYVQEEQKLIPASETSFAADKSFGYTHSNLYDWACEKDPSLKKQDIFDISIYELRTGTLEQVTEKILGHLQAKVMVVNAADYQDLERFVIALQNAHQINPFNYLFRSAASIVPVVGRIERKAVLSGEKLVEKGKAGLIVVGSYVPKTSNQLSQLIAGSDIHAIEIEAEKLTGRERAKEIKQKSRKIDELISQGIDVVTFTTRKLIASDSKEESLRIINAVSSGVVEIVSRLSARPSYLIAKGGITSSDVATESLRIRKAMVMGQILPGVPVWKAGEESKFPGLSYIVFPGNVGDNNALLEVYLKLKKASK